MKMHKIRWIAGLHTAGVAAVLLSAAAQALTVPTTQPSTAAAAAAAAPALRPSAMTAEAIVERSVRASGGLSAWRSVKTMKMTGLMDAGQKRDPAPTPVVSQRLEKAVNRAAARKLLLEAGKDDKKVDKTIRLPFALEMKRGRKQRVEVQFEGQTAVQVYDGSNGWKVRPFLNRHQVEAFTPEQAKLAADQQDLDGLLVDYERKGTKIAVEGIESVAGNDAYRLKLALKDGSERRAWVDAKSFLQVQVDGTRRVNGHEVPVYTRLSDYRPVEGVMIPYVTETIVQGAPSSGKIVLDRVAINVPLADDRFSKPE
jgi:hypothetical protein